ncbi:MFS transporter [Clostridium sp. P21]|uniref:MFS transporter n=1 Tax=Clostridium muellerianum TaxID=2716538 RepID=A0A7Y0HQG4_9CLOT|nr:MFS transporter [Clostridium muellerianum]NMM63783.1 MFS transporter [Clostridium muellerianum]
MIHIPKIRENWHFKVLIILLSKGLSSLGDYIYLICINIYILKNTNSPILVSSIWVIPYAASILTKFWSGSVLDKSNKKIFMILINVFSGILLIFMVYVKNLAIIYLLIFFLNIGSSIYNSASFPYFTESIPPNKRTRLNSIQGMLNCGSAVIGPAAAGIILKFSTVSTAIIVNSMSFFAAAILLSLMPTYKIKNNNLANKSPNIAKSLAADWKNTYDFMIYKNSKFAILNFLYIIIIVISASLDSQEVVFATKILKLNSSEYSILFAMAGAGYVLGCSLLTILGNKISNKNLLKFGSIFSALGFIMYSFSNSLIIAGTGFLMVGFFQSLCSTGYTTSLQENIPISILSRITSSISFFQSILTIIFMFLIGVLSTYIGIRHVIISSSILIFILSIVMSHIININNINTLENNIKT